MHERAETDRRWPWLLLLPLLALAVLIYRAQRLPEGPQPIVWDREACAHCHMHIGEPRFALMMSRIVLARSGLPYRAPISWPFSLYRRFARRPLRRPP